MDEVGLGRALQDARKKAGYTQQALCQRAGLSYSTLAKIERGAIKAPSIFTIHSIAEALNLTLDELLSSLLPKKITDKKKVSKSGIRFVYFDINGCLVQFFHRAFTKIAHETTYPVDKIELAFWHHNDAVCRGELTIEEFNKKMGEEIGISHFDWRSYYIEAIEPIAEMYEMVFWAAEHYHVGLLTNIMPGQIQNMLDSGILPDVEYSSIVDSSEVGAIKPEAQIFEVAQQKSEVEPHEILFIDDSRANVMAAEKLGWRVMWFNDHNPEESAARVKAALEF
jgi:FMN phosphatase YigB (HAD superfamily)/DNA-binding XRE family transcriptional regulator